MQRARFRRWFLLAGLTALLAMATVTPTFAQRPVTETFSDAGTSTIDCGGFQVLARYIVNVRTTTFFDQRDQPASAQIHMYLDGTLTNQTTGLTLRDPWHNTTFVDLTTGESTVTGLLFGITVPGRGVAVLDAGKLVFDAAGNVTFEGGPHQLLREGEALICAALAG